MIAGMTIQFYKEINGKNWYLNSDLGDGNRSRWDAQRALTESEKSFHMAWADVAGVTFSGDDLETYCSSNLNRLASQHVRAGQQRIQRLNELYQPSKT